MWNHIKDTSDPCTNLCFLAEPTSEWKAAVWSGDFFLQQNVIVDPQLWGTTIPLNMVTGLIFPLTLAHFSCWKDSAPVWDVYMEVSAHGYVLMPWLSLPSAEVEAKLSGETRARLGFPGTDTSTWAPCLCWRKGYSAKGDDRGHAEGIIKKFRERKNIQIHREPDTYLLFCSQNISFHLSDHNISDQGPALIFWKNALTQQCKIYKSIPVWRQSKTQNQMFNITTFRIYLLLMQLKFHFLAPIHFTRLARYNTRSPRWWSTDLSLPRLLISLKSTL